MNKTKDFSVNTCVLWERYTGCLIRSRATGSLSGVGFIVGALIAFLMGGILKKMIQTGREYNAWWVILSVLYVLAVLYHPMLEIYYRL